MIDLEKDVTHIILTKLEGLILSPESYFMLFLYIFTKHRFSVTFCRKFCRLVDWLRAKSTITPSRSGDEDKKGDYD